MITVRAVREEDIAKVSEMVGELLHEIMDAIGEKVFNFDAEATKERAAEYLGQNRYWVFVAVEPETDEYVGFISLYESYALYSEGVYGTIPELYVRASWRSKGVGKKLLEAAKHLAGEKGWRRFEVTTPPLPQFDRTLQFYEQNGFSISGGRKLKVDM